MHMGFVVVGLLGVVATLWWWSRKTSSRQPPASKQPSLPLVIDTEATTVVTPEAPSWMPEEPTRTMAVDSPLEAPQPLPDAALKQGLSKTHRSFWGALGALLSKKPALDAALFEHLEEVLLTADVGISLTTQLLTRLKNDIASQKITSSEEITERLQLYMRESLALPEGATVFNPRAGSNKPYVVMFVGVNGVGKTTTIGKIASKLSSQGLKVVLGAGDTFRAAASQQLAVWAERANADIVTGAEGADPSSVLFSAVEQAQKNQADVVLADTAGRLHTKTSLMDEIKKVKRVLGKARENAPDDIWLVVDASTGQNALQQAKEFHQALGLTGVVLTKLDGTAKGGIVMAIVDTLQIPIKFIGIGEQAEDLRPFDPQTFVTALFDNAA
jgi:fused signal recognition particle receptor